MMTYYNDVTVISTHSAHRSCSHSEIQIYLNEKTGKLRYVLRLNYAHSVWLKNIPSAPAVRSLRVTICLFIFAKHRP